MLHHSGLLNASHRGNDVVFVDNCYGELVKDLEPTAVGAYLYPLPAPMPGYGSELRMAGGTVIDGSTTESSADAPLREP